MPDYLNGPNGTVLDVKQEADDSVSEMTCDKIPLAGAGYEPRNVGIEKEEWFFK